MRILLLMPTTTYRADDFLAAADKLGVEVVLGTDRCHLLEEQGAVTLSRKSLVLDLLHPEEAAATVVEAAREEPFAGIVAVDDQTTEVAARASAALRLPHNPVDAAAATRDKLEMRRRFAAGGVRQPRFHAIGVGVDPEKTAREAESAVGFPCVLKPRMLSASRGVIRADDAHGFAGAFSRITRLLRDPEIRARGGNRAESILVESFVPGVEVALEGVLARGELEVLALFDKPDPLDGPYFEETLYVTPSRLDAATQKAIVDETAKAARAIGLEEGPVHAEARVGADGKIWMLEIAARSIGGLCSRTLRFGSGMSLEEVLIRQALWRAGKGEHVTARREGGAAGVMMLPIRASGVFRGVEGVEAARSVKGVEELTITAIEGREVTALPEGSSYLGFLFARGETAEGVEAVLRAAYGKLSIRIAASLARADGP